MKILITGVCGFVGTNLVRALSPNHTIYGLDLILEDRPGVEKIYSWEDLEHGLIPDVDAIVHLAGKAHDTKNSALADVYFAVNTKLTQKMYDYFLASSARKFLFFSSAKAAADRVDGILTEDVIPAPVGPYGESKIRAEAYIMSNLQQGKDVYILRPCMIHGPGNKGNLNLLYSVVSKGIPWPLGSFDNLRTSTSVDNVAFVVSNLLTRDIPTGIYNMGDDEPLSTNELVEIICSSLGKKARIWRLPKGMMVAAAKVGGWLHLPLNPDRLRKLTETYVSSNAKLKAALGITQMPVRSRDGMKKTMDYFAAER